MKLALILNVIDPYIGGVLVMGHRGTGKSTAVRGLADLLPEVKKVKGCVYGCDPSATNLLCDDCKQRLRPGKALPEIAGHVPVVDLPLGATEDRICGTLDIERALTAGVKSFEPGLLAKANRGFIYIDEVNLLEDHLVDVLLDVAASGRNIVEREGISIAHPSRFVLVGSGNPEEGELRPQLLDRFGLYVEIETIYDLDDRVEIVKRRERFELNPIRFLKEQEHEQKNLRTKIVKARQILDSTIIDQSLLRQIAELCVRLKIDGHRGELTMMRASRALAAFNGRRAVTDDDVRRIAPMSLHHRLRKDPLESIGSKTKIDREVESLFVDQRQGTGKVQSLA
jgi:magnesium chelatase subunit I